MVTNKIIIKIKPKTSVLNLFKNKSDGSLIANLPETIFTIQLNDNREQCICGTQNGNILILDLNKKKIVKHLQLNSGSIFDIEHFDDHNYIIACGNGSIIFLDKNNFSVKSKIPVSKSSVRCLKISDKYISAGCSDHSIYAINKRSFKIDKSLSEHDSSVFCLTFNNSGKLISGSRDAHLNLWSNDFKMQKRIPAHNFTINSIALNPNPLYKLIATASRDKSIKIWDSESLDLYKVINNQKEYSHQRSVNNILWLDDNYLISASDDKSLILWELEIN